MSIFIPLTDELKELELVPAREWELKNYVTPMNLNSCLYFGKTYYTKRLLILFINEIVMGSIVKSWYRYSIDTLAKVSIVSILNPHHELYIPKLVMYFDFRTLNFLDFFNLCPVPSYFHFRFFFFCIFGHYSSDNTKYRYLNKVSILKDIKRYRYSIDSINTISHHYNEITKTFTKTRTKNQKKFDDGKVNNACFVAPPNETMAR